LADLAPKSGTLIAYGSGKGAEKLFQELLNDGGSAPANIAPVAEDDSASTAAGKAATIAVLANDRDGDGDILALDAFTQGASGSVSRNANNTPDNRADDTLTYTPKAGFTGPDSFTYTVSDDNGGSDTATVTVNVGAALVVGATINASSADPNFSGGNIYKTSAAIANTTNDTLYQSERYGNFGYAVDVADGTYNVTLQFAEIYWDAAGKRVFDVAAEGKLILDNLDIFSAAGGKNIAYDFTVPVAVSDGTLNLQFTTVTDNAKISAIRIEGLGDVAATNAELHVDSGFVTDPLLV
jgi:hypothetical protein